MQPPTEEVFEEMKKAATEIWQTYSNEFGYVDEKLERINSFKNIQDNAMIFYRMFDSSNQNRMNSKLSLEAIKYIASNY